MKSGKIWVIEDEDNILFVYKQMLDDLYETRYFKSIKSITEAVQEEENLPEMLVSDLNVQDGNFLNYLMDNKNDSLLTVPFIIVSGLDQMDVLENAYNTGAEDFLVKPFNTNELLFKIKRVMRQRKEAVNVKEASRKIFYAPSITIDGITVENLTSKQVQMLELFAESRENGLGREELLSKVWKDADINQKTIDVHIYNLRRKIKPYGFIIQSSGKGKWSLISQYK